MLHSVTSNPAGGQALGDGRDARVHRGVVSTEDDCAHDVRTLSARMNALKAQDLAKRVLGSRLLKWAVVVVAVGVGAYEISKEWQRSPPGARPDRRARLASRRCSRCS